MNLQSNQLIFTDDEYSRTALPPAIPGGVAYYDRIYDPDVIPACCPDSTFRVIRSLCRKQKIRPLADLFGVPTGIRTPVTAVKGRCPRPLDDGDCGLQEKIDRIYTIYRTKPSLRTLLILLVLSIRVKLVEVSGIEPLTSCMPCKRSPS